MSTTATSNPIRDDVRWHTLTAAQTFDRLNTRDDGLSADEATSRLATFGPNRLPEQTERSAMLRFAHQFKNLLIYVLLGAATLSLAIGHMMDAAVIFAVVLINAVIGFIQEGRAVRALDAIRAMIDPRANVIRAGARLTIDAPDIVPGDVVLLASGDRVAADLRLIRARGLRVDESALTGESVAVDKRIEPVAADAELGARTCLVHSGTLVTAGQAAGVAVATGAATELGHISTLIETVQSLQTPLIRQMNTFAQRVTAAILVLSGLVFAFAVNVRTYSASDAFMAVVGIAVAAIPEGLPAVMTVALAIGVQRMASRHAIVRRLPVVETLGSVSVICSDKTGTLTRNEMTVRALATTSGIVEVTGTGYEPVGDLRMKDAPVEPSEDAVLIELIRAGLLCNDAKLNMHDHEWTVDGDPMEGALLCLAGKAGIDVEATRKRFPRRDEIPFDTEHRFMASLHHDHEGESFIVLKGAPERVVSMCSSALTATGNETIDADHWHAQTDTFASEGLRVIAVARKAVTRDTGTLQFDDVEHDLTLTGLIGLIDPPRDEAIQAVAECRTAGIAVKMITGDHAETARAIARQLGLADDPQVVLGRSLDSLSSHDLQTLARDAVVFARTTPEHKLQLVEALQADGDVIAMTGDGANDAAALKRADVGIAMGHRGTEAAKEASAMVLADDNFASIVAAVKEGRTVYDNLTKVIAWTLPTSAGEALSIALAILFGLTLPVTAVQILWINMITVVCLGLTLAFEPAEPSTMQRPPRPTDQPLLSARTMWRVTFVSVWVVAGAFGMFFAAIDRGLPLDAARTIVVNTIVVMEIFYLFSVRYVHGTSLTLRGAFGTKAVMIGIFAVTVGQLSMTYAAPLQTILGTAAVGVEDGLAILAVGVVFFVIVEVEKAFVRRLDSSAADNA